MRVRNLMDLEEKRAKAARARAAFYGTAPPARPVEHVTGSGKPIAPPVERVPAVIMEGKPCPGQNATWRALPRKAVEMWAVLRSADVPKVVYAERMAACEACEYVTRARGLLWCGCCGCGRWSAGKVSSAVQYKNRKSRWFCPGPHAAFGRAEAE